MNLKGGGSYEILFIRLCSQSDQSAELGYDYCVNALSNCDYFFAFKAFKDKKGSKFRELLIISILTLIAFVLISITNFQTSQYNDNQFRSYLHFIEIVSKELGVDKKDVYVNTSATTDGAIIKVGDNFYRAINGTDQDSYLLEKMELYKSDVELIYSPYSGQ